MSLSREMATMNEEDLREAVYKIATNFLARGGGDGRKFDYWMRDHVSHTLHAAGWPKDRLRQFRQTWRHEFARAKANYTKECEG